MPDLFSLVLPAAFSAATSWATKRVLDAVVGCPSCGKESPSEIHNAATSNLVCTSCAVGIGQYSIANENTIRRNHRLMCANIFNPHWKKHIEGFIFKKFTGHWFLLDVHTVGMKDHGIAIEVEFKDMRTGKTWSTQPLFRNDDHERMNFLRQGWLIGHCFPNGAAIVADVKLKTTDGDILHNLAPLANFVAA